jgi:hypothetical protein
VARSHLNHRFVLHREGRVFLQENRKGAELEPPQRFDAKLPDRPTRVLDAGAVGAIEEQIRTRFFALAPGYPVLERRRSYAARGLTPAPKSFSSAGRHRSQKPRRKRSRRAAGVAGRRGRGREGIVSEGLVLGVGARGGRRAWRAGGQEAEVLEDVADDVWVGEAGDDLEAAVALGTAGDVLVEHAAEERGPIEPAWPGRLRSASLGLSSGERRCMAVAGLVGTLLAGDDERPALAPRGEHAVVPEALWRGGVQRCSSDSDGGGAGCGRRPASADGGAETGGPPPPAPRLEGAPSLASGLRTSSGSQGAGELIAQGAAKLTA